MFDSIIYLLLDLFNNFYLPQLDLIYNKAQTVVQTEENTRTL